ncbi:hypothetical protein EV182_007571, partial [Spiromyces aspiralis]
MRCTRVPAPQPILGDILEVDHSRIIEALDISPSNADQAIKKVHVIGNLPFNIATPLLIKWLYQIYRHEGVFECPDASLTLMFQKEVSRRIVAPPSSPERSRLSIMTQSLCRAREIYTVRSSSFVPRPKVDASVVQLERLDEPIL